MIALVDCNNFYASCEQVFRPDLWGKPIVVLSNNDGCIIAANKEAKAIQDFPLFQAVFKVRKQLEQHDIKMFSSNYTLYGEMSQRVSNILSRFSPNVEIYSIDESFIDLSGLKHIDLMEYGHTIKETIYKETGLPVGIGIASTKVLAKLANRMAKKIESNDYVCVIDSEKKQIEALKWAKVGDIWGIGKNHVKRLQAIGRYQAYDFITLPLHWVRKEMTVVGERLWRELQGESCLELQTLPKSKKAIATAKSFGRRLEDFSLIAEACAYYISEVSEVLRNQQSCATYVQVFLHTNYHSKIDKQYSKSITITLPLPTYNTLHLINAAHKGLQKIYKSGYRYKKVGVCLSGIIPATYVQGNLFESVCTTDKALMKTFDAINAKYGKSTVFSGLVGTRVSEWELIKKERSPRYTTQWKELLTIA